MGRIIRYQGAIVRDDHILLIKHREYATGRDYWVIPGGGREHGETEEECVKREMKEETHLDVTVKELILDISGRANDAYEHYKTYLCIPISGEAYPGHEPEFEAAERYEIAEVGWFDLRDETTWDEKIITNQFTYPSLQKIQKVLGYDSKK